MHVEGDNCLTNIKSLLMYSKKKGARKAKIILTKIFTFKYTLKK